ncbi:MAG: PKD domain-containing protein, partial [Nanoarchaeota archaeon]
DFGDGQKLYDLPQDNVYHTYADGTYLVTCASNGVKRILEIQVGGITEEEMDILKVDAWYPQQNKYVFICDHEADSYDWDFGDGQKLWDVEEQSVYHEFAPGDYTVACVARDDDEHVTGYLGIRVEGDPRHPPDGYVDVLVAPWYPQQAGDMYHYVLICDKEADSYDWEFGDGTKLFDLPSADVFHTYPAGEEFDVTCVAKTDGEEYVGHRELMVPDAVDEEIIDDGVNETPINETPGNETSGNQTEEDEILV